VEIEALEARSWGMRVVHVAPAHEEAWRAIEAPFMGYQRRMSVLRSDSTGGSVPGSFDRSLLRLRDFRDYLADGWALVGTPAEVRDGLVQYRERLFAEQIAPVMIPAWARRIVTCPCRRSRPTPAP
jgi:alkanesulfonate monooxygenase SsuD/methylene tetrahydromethanopterin reductase-like flavin-dependent oxidoreductase (luciferase family)